MSHLCRFLSAYFDASALKELDGRIFLDDADCPCSKGPIWLDDKLPELGQWNPDKGVRLGEYIPAIPPEKSKIILYTRCIEQLEAGSYAIFGVGTLFSVVLVHELAHWVTWSESGPDAFHSSDKYLAKDMSETLAELVSWLVFHRTPASPNADWLAACQRRTNEDAPSYVYRLYWQWLVMFGLIGNESPDSGHEHARLPFLKHVLKQIIGGNYAEPGLNDLLSDNRDYVFQGWCDDEKVWNPWSWDSIQQQKSNYEVRYQVLKGYRLAHWNHTEAQVQIGNDLEGLLGL